MGQQFSPAVQRAIESAALWSGPGDGDEIDLPQLLLGLLSQAECRAAQVLMEKGVSADFVRQHWHLHPRKPDARTHRPNFSIAVQRAIDTACGRLIDYPHPLTLTTEQVLLGIVAAPSEVAQVLAERGLDAGELEAQVHRWHGHDPRPLDVEGFALSSPRPPEAGLDGPAAEPTPAEPTPAQRAAVLRVLDAAGNRAAEGLRVLEDQARFVLEDRHLAEQLKSARHELCAVLDTFPREERLACRDTLGDVGTTIAAADEDRRTDPAAVLAANAQRVQQALRSLEEYAKIVAPAAAPRFEALRYRLYTLDRALGIRGRADRLLADARLYVLLDGRESADDFRRLALELVAAGVHVLQLRDKRLDDRTLLQRARQLRELTDGTRTLFVMNDRPDIAFLARADGVHVGQEELSIGDCRRIVGPQMLIGCSTHNLQQAQRAVLEGADYLGAGPVFASQTKSFKQLAGLDYLRQVPQEIGLPAFAIGGITLENLGHVLATGVRRVAVGAAIVGSDHPGAAARQFLAVLAGAANEQRSGG